MSYKIIRTPPTMEEFARMVSKDHRVKGVIVVDLSAIMGGIDILNELADDLILPEGTGSSLSDLSYRLVGMEPTKNDASHVSGTIHLEVDALIEDDALLADVERFAAFVFRAHISKKYFREPDQWVENWRQASSYTEEELNGDDPDLLPDDVPVERVKVDELLVDLRLKAVFIPQRWDDDNVVVQVDKRVEFDATAALLALPLAKIREFEGGSYDSDGLADDLPERINHDGPFEVYVEVDDWLDRLDMPPHELIDDQQLADLRRLFGVQEAK